MLNIKDILKAMKEVQVELEVCYFEERFAKMPYFLGKLQGYNELLLEIIAERLYEPKSEKDENES